MTDSTYMAQDPDFIPGYQFPTLKVHWEDDPVLDTYARAHLREVEERERAGWEVCPLPPSPWQKRLSLWRLRRLTEVMREAVEQGRLEL